jgi:hypothetical protein
MWPLCIEVLTGTAGVNRNRGGSRSGWCYYANEYEYPRPESRADGTIQCGGFLAMVNDETVQWKLGGFELQVR